MLENTLMFWYFPWSFELGIHAKFNETMTNQTLITSGLGWFSVVIYQSKIILINLMHRWLCFNYLSGVWGDWCLTILESASGAHWCLTILESASGAHWCLTILESASGAHWCILFVNAHNVGKTSDSRTELINWMDKHVHFENLSFCVFNEAQN